MAKKRPQSTQHPQKGKSLEQLNPYDRLEEYQQVAVDMKLYLYSYRVISRAMKKAGRTDKENTIRKWFVKGEPCALALEWKRKIVYEETRRELAEVDRMIEIGQPIAISALMAKAERGDFFAIKLLLALGGRSEVQKVEDVTKDKKAKEILQNIIKDIKKDDAHTKTKEDGAEAPNLVQD